MALNFSPSLGPFQCTLPDSAGPFFNVISSGPNYRLSMPQDIFVKRFSILSRILLFVVKASVSLQPNKSK